MNTIRRGDGYFCQEGPGEAGSEDMEAALTGVKP